MTTILQSIPITPCYLRNEFMFNQESGHGEFTEGYAFAFRGVAGRIPCFQFMTINGAQWANVPVHMLTTKKDVKPLAPNIASWWDCFSNTFAVTELMMLRGVHAECRGRDKVIRKGVYKFTVDWIGSWADIADQHKQHHIIELDDGNLVAYPNNKVLWRDSSWYTPFTEIPKYLANTHNFSCETDDIIVNMGQQDYEVAPTVVK